MTPSQNSFVSHFQSRSIKRATLITALAFALPACTSMQSNEFAAAGLEVKPHSLQHEDIDSAFAQGLRYLNEGNAAAAEQSFTRVLKVKPRNAEASLGLAESQLSLSRFDEAITTFREVAQKPKHYAVATQGQGIALLLKGHRALAKERLESAVADDPTLWRAWSALGQLKDSEHSWAESEIAYRTALENNPNAGSVHNNLGMSFLTQGRTEEALIRFEEALLVDPSLMPARSNRQIALSILGRYKEALENVSDEDRHVALNNIGYIAMTRGDLKRAHFLLNRSAEMSPVYYAVAEQNLNRVKQAMSHKQIVQ